MFNIYQLEQQIEAGIKAAHIPGLALAIVKDQEVLYARGFGVTSVEDGGLVVTPQTLFRIGSTTKPLTGTAVMRLVEAGKLDLDRPIKEYLDWFTPIDPDAERRITLRMLMTHTAGFITQAEHFGTREAAGLQEQMRKAIATLPFIAPPGTAFSYSNPGISLVGCILEAITGQYYAEIMQELVFDPLKMKRTTFDPTIAMTYPLAQSHSLNEDDTLSVQHRFAENTAHTPGGFAMSTVLDLANFAIMQMNQGRFRDTQLLGPEAIAEMQKVQTSLYTTNGAGYGLTFFLESYKGLLKVGHEGGISSFVSHFEMFPEAGVALIMLYNRAAHDFMYAQISRQVFDQLLDAPKEESIPETTEPDKAVWPGYTGRYISAFSGLATIEIADDQLTLDFNGQKVSLEALKPDLYFYRSSDGAQSFSVGFIPQQEGRTRYIMVNSLLFERTASDLDFTPDPAMWQAFAGKYRGEVGFAWQIEIQVEDGQLFVIMKEGSKAVKLPTTALSNVCFAGAFGMIEFLTNESMLILAKAFKLTRLTE